MRESDNNEFTFWMPFFKRVISTIKKKEKKNSPSKAKI